MTKILIFGLLSIPIIIVSWRTFFDFKSHGIYRFFGWECILCLLVCNFPYWIKEPLSFKQILSWILLIYSLYTVIEAVVLMKKMGKSKAERKGDTLYKFEKTSQLIRTGIFKYIRHPMYASLIFLTWGIFLKNTTLPLLIVSILSTIFLYVTSFIEEKENIAYFGDQYREYMKKSKMFVPFLI